MLLDNAGIDGLQSDKSLIAEALEPLRASRIECECKAQEYTLAVAEAKTTEKAVCEIGPTKSRLERVAEDACAGLRQVSQIRIRSAIYLRHFRYLHQVFRNADEPDRMMTAFLALVCILVETAMTGTLLCGEGKLDWASGYGCGVVFAVVNVGWGLTCGFFARFINCRTPPQDVTGARLRRIGGAAIITYAAFSFLLIMTACRTRAMGGFTDIWNFHALSFWETFNDSLSIATMTLSLLALIISFHKGFVGIDDSIPGHKKRQEEAEEGPNERALDIFEQAEEALEEIYEYKISDYEDQIDKAEKTRENCRTLYPALIARLLKHNQAVLAGKDTVRAALAKNMGIRRYVLGNQPEPVALELQAFDALLFSEEPAPPPVGRDASEALRAAREALYAEADCARARIDTAYAAFWANAPDLSAATPEGGS